MSLLAACTMLLFIGDSLTRPGSVTPAGIGYVERLETWSGLPVVNASVAGATTWDYVPGARYWVSEVEPALPADCVVYFLGVNDATPTATTDIDFSTNATLTTFELVAQGTDRIFVVKPPDRFDESDPSQERIDSYAGILENLCDVDENAFCVADLRPVLDFGLGHYNPEIFGGKVHPNESGQTAIAGAVWGGLATSVPSPGRNGLLVAVLLLLGTMAARRQ